jgi:hypothetical protein
MDSWETFLLIFVSLGFLFAIVEVVVNMIRDPAPEPPLPPR